MSLGKQLAGVAAMAMVASTAQASVTTFSLPPAPTPTPDVVGPVPEDAPAAQPSSTPTTAATPTPRPTTTPRSTQPSRPAPTSTPVIQAIPTGPARTGPTPQPARSQPRRQSPVSTATATPTPAPSVASTPDSTAEATETATEALPLPAATQTGAPLSPMQEPAAPSGLPWWAWLGAALLLAGGIAAFFLGRRSAGGTAVPEVERPVIKPKAPAPEAQANQPSAPASLKPNPAPPNPPPAAPVAPAPAPAALALEGLEILFEPRQITISMMNATLGYRMVLANRGEEALADITINADLVSAHSSIPREELLASAHLALPELHRISSLAIGEEKVLTGSIVRPLSDVRAIQRGNAAFMVPLLRLQITQGTNTLHQTLLLGLPPMQQGGALMPIRLDQGLGSHAPLLQRSFA